MSDLEISDLEEMSDEELAEAYKSITKEAGVGRKVAKKPIKQYEREKQKNNPDQQRLAKLKENAEQAKELRKKYKKFVDAAKKEVESRGINPYSY